MEKPKLTVNEKFALVIKCWAMPEYVGVMLPGSSLLTCDEVAAAFTAAAASAVEPVKVNPLEWEDCGELGWCADTIVGRYWVEQVHVAFRTRLVTLVAENETWIDIVDGKGFEAAKNAAQADYEARVRSALAVAS